jgi:uncharacterized Tic20 family protein
VSVRTIQRIEQGYVRPRLSTLKFLSEALDYNLSNITTNDRIDQTLLFFVHLSTILDIILFPILVIIWNNSMSKTLEREAKRAINFQISYLLLMLISWAIIASGYFYLPLVVVGIVLLASLVVIVTVLSVRNMLAVAKKQKPIYLFEIKYIKI